ncbi:hypothetical protein FGO68_gene12854 [Halteria grandinella]|uniref:Uncharacterized protein n=1 Tax=Halteria grandinella TaxID=5974 RepID=A0A8J8NDQ8_HALGN|nr:hypothetical protein FGO68_gene12854 [Halteria grandinella]
MHPALSATGTCAFYLPEENQYFFLHPFQLYLFQQFCYFQYLCSSICYRQLTQSLKRQYSLKKLEIGQETAINKLSRY